MSLSALWKLTGIVTQGGQILGITDQEFSSGIEEVLAGSASTVDTEFAGVGEAKPMLSFTTTDLAHALAIIGLDGYSLGGATDFYFSKYAGQGVVSTSSVHLKLTATVGMIVLRTLEASQGKEPAKLACELHALSTDGKVNPITIAHNTALPSFGTNTAVFGLGPVEVSGGSLTGVQSVRWDFSIKPEVMGSDGEAYPTFAAIVDRPGVRCAINGADLTGLYTFGTAGTALTSFASYFRQRAAGSTYIADATATHIKLSGTLGMLYPKGTKGRDGKPMDGDWNIVAANDGTHNVVAVSTASAVT